MDMLVRGSFVCGREHDMNQKKKNNLIYAVGHYRHINIQIQKTNTNSECMPAIIWMFAVCA